jgi:hypothetical protein
MTSDEFDDFGFTMVDKGTISVLTGVVAIEQELEEERLRLQKMRKTIFAFLDKLASGDGDYISWPKQKRVSDIERFKKTIDKIYDDSV